MKADKINREMFEVLDLIVAEFKSDPMSTACFDRRIIDRAISIVDKAKP